MKKSSLSKLGKSECSKMEKKCDLMLTPIIKKIHPFCECCGLPTQVAHHWIEKSRSNRLRYEIDNLIGLCNSCHTKIHNRFGNNIIGGVDIVEQIRRQRGEEWYQRMITLSRDIIKKDIIYYQDSYKKLTRLLTE